MKRGFSGILQSNERFFHSHKKRNDSMETRAVLLIFLLELEISGVAVQNIHQNSEKWWLCELMLSEHNLEAVLATFYCYDYSANASEPGQKFASDQKRLSQMLFVWYSLLNSQNISINSSE